MNMNNLQSALFGTAICKFCKSSKGGLMLFQNDQHRRGLDEELIIQCQNCHENTSFYTSARVRGEAGRSSEVNARCVQAILFKLYYSSYKQQYYWGRKSISISE